jgi:hypothetical protein
MNEDYRKEKSDEIVVLWPIEDKDNTKNVAKEISPRHDDKISLAPSDHEEARNNKVSNGKTSLKIK